MGSGSKKNLLIIDDVELFIQLQISHLGRKRFDIHTASNGNLGIEMARSIKPDLILLDLLMPDINGDQVCRILKGDPDTSSIPIVLVSSGTREGSRAIIDSSGCDGLIFKPVRRDLLLSVVESLLKTNTRSFERVEVSIPCTVTMDEREHHGTIHSLGSTGVFVEVNRPMIRGDLMEMMFTLPALAGNINVRAGAVIWCGSLRDDGPEGAGVQFLTISAESQKQISDFVRMQLGGGLVTGEGK
jgi:CheY-like chemotaxis protein/Tfp pilus assembly protein PilZ